MHHIILALLGLVITLAHANVEKTIFLAPPPTAIPSEAPGLDDFGLERLSPQNAVVRTQLNASFPTAETPAGTDSWFFLENLNPGQRYEVRVCWLATQPTSFTLSTHPLPLTADDPALLSSLTTFSANRLASLASNPQAHLPSLRQHSKTPAAQDHAAQDHAPTSDSVLFLRVRAAADYFSPDPALMRDVPPVAVDVILDPFLWNVFPRSLGPTATWGVVVAIVAGCVGRWVVGELGRVIEDARVEREEEGKKVR